MYRAGWLYLLAAAVLVGALNCNPSIPGPEPAQESARGGLTASPPTADGGSSSLEIKLGDYNLFLLGDYSGGCSVGGKVAAGGNIRMNGFDVGSKLSADNLSNALVAGGELALDSCGFRGDAWYGRGDESTHTFAPSVVCGRETCTATRGSPIDFPTRFAQLRDLSSRLATQPKSNAPRFEYGVMYLKGESSCLNVFDVNASELNGLWKWDLTGPTRSLLVLNIHGEAPSFPSNLKLNGGLTAQGVLYNVVDATGFSVRNSGFQGTLLAPKAHITVQNGSWSGGIYAASLSCAGGFSLDNNPLDELPNKAQETCNGADDNCDGQVDEGFECTGSGTRSCTAWCGAAGTQSCDPATCGYGPCTSSSCCNADADCGNGSYCAGSICTPLKDNGAACDSANQCGSGQCVDGVCCNTACAGACNSCDAAGSVGTCTNFPAGSPGIPACAPYVCSGSSESCPTACTQDSQCITGNYCNAGACVPKKDNGAACSAANQCGSGNCADGVCCNSACAGACGSCNAAGSVGTCTNFPVGSPGIPACAPYVCSGSSEGCPTACTQDSQCITGNYCNAGACVPKKDNGAACSAANQCGSGTCVDGVCCNSACGGACDACNVAGSVGTCTPVASGSSGSPACAPYVCTGSSASCPTACTTNSQCASGNICSSGACLPLKTNGAACSASTQCASGQCVDGVCCNSACGGDCNACNVAGSMGTCAPVPYGMTCGDDGNECTRDICNGAGSCNHSPRTGESCGSGMVCSSAGTCEETTASCSSTTKRWYEDQPAWNGNPATAGRYFCSGSIPAASHGSSYRVTMSSGDRRGSATYECKNGSWERKDGTEESCDGTVWTATIVKCSDLNDTRQMWIDWYIEDLRRCADRGGLDWWSKLYDGNDNHCLAYGKYTQAYKDCFRAEFRKSAEHREVAAQTDGPHITSASESSQCGWPRSAPWSNIKSAGNGCKHRP